MPRSERDKPRSIGPERKRRDPEKISTRRASSWRRKRRRSRVPVASSQLAKRPSRSEKSPCRRWRPTSRRGKGLSPRPRRNGKGVSARHADEDLDGEGNGPERTRDAVGAARTGFESQRGRTSSRAGGTRFPKERTGGGRARAGRGVPSDRGRSEGACTGPSDPEEPREAGRSRLEETGGAPRGDHGPRTGCDGEGGDGWEPGDRAGPRGAGAQGETFGSGEGFIRNQRPRGRCGEARGRPERDRISVGEKRDRIEQGRAGPGEEKDRGRPRREGAAALRGAPRGRSPSIRGGTGAAGPGEDRGRETREGTRIAGGLARETRRGRRRHQVEGDEPPQVCGEDGRDERPRGERSHGRTTGPPGGAAKGTGEGDPGPRRPRTARTSVRHGQGRIRCEGEGRGATRETVEDPG